MQPAKLLKPWLHVNPSANQCTKASSESGCVDGLYVIKSDRFNFFFHSYTPCDWLNSDHTFTSSKPSTNRVACKNERKIEPIRFDYI